MKIGVSTLALYPKSLEEILTYLEDIDVKYCEIINECPYDSIDVDMVNSFNLKISVHSPLSDINIASHNKAIRKSSINEIKKSIELASKFGSDIIVVHPGHAAFLALKFKEKILENNLNSLKECAEYAKDHGVMMCIENMPNFEWMLCKELQELDEIVQEIDAYMTLDVGHANSMNIGIEEMVKYERVRHIHLSDNDGSYDQHNSLGSDSIDFKLLFEKLKKAKYDGIMVVEVKYPNEVMESLEYLKSNF